MKYKVGDSVRIVACTRGHEFEIGEIVGGLWIMK